MTVQGGYRERGVTNSSSRLWGGRVVRSAESAGREPIVERRVAWRLGLLLATSAVLFAAMVGSAAAARTGVAVSASVVARTASIGFTVNRGPQGIAALSCTLDGNPASCGNRIGSTKQTASYSVSVGNLDSGSHVYAVVARLTDGGVGGGQAAFTVAVAAACQVKNQSTGVRYDGAGANLQTAINGATPGDTLTVQGLCTGNYTLNGNLMLTGVGSSRATLDGGYTGGAVYPGPVVTVNSAVTATIVNLTLQHGALEPSNGEGGLLNMGTVTLTNSSVSHNTGTGVTDIGAASVLILNGSTSVDSNVAQGDGGGVRNLGGSVTLDDSSTVGGNQANRGGGIYNDTLGTVRLNGGSSISGNTADGQGGGVFNAFGSVSLHDSSTISDNTASYGGGVGNFSFLILNDGSRVSGNTARLTGGGVSNDNGTVVLNGNSGVSGNAARTGGGIFSGRGRSVTLNDSSSVSGNTARDAGGGIYNQGNMILNGSSSISGNTGDIAGGVYNEISSSVRMNDTSSIHDNTAVQVGGGILNSRGGLLVNCNPGVNVFNNSPNDIFP